MSDIDAVLARIESDLDFNLAVRADPRQALSSFDLEEAELSAFETPGRALWSLVLRRTAQDDVELPDGGLPPPPPPFTVQHSQTDQLIDPVSLRADSAIAATVATIRTARGAAQEHAVAELMGQIG
jgi:hypothetical protein